VVSGAAEFVPPAVNNVGNFGRGVGDSGGGQRAWLAKQRAADEEDEDLLLLLG
jgi:hypothetical protein